MLSDVSYDHNKAFPALNCLSLICQSNGDYAISKSHADRLTKQLFGRTLYFSKLKRASLTNSADYHNFCYVYQDMLYYGMAVSREQFSAFRSPCMIWRDGYFAAGMIEERRYDDGMLLLSRRATGRRLKSMLRAHCRYIQQKTGETVLTAGGSLVGYSEAGRVSAYAKEAVDALAKDDIMQGTGATELSPQDNCSAEQSVLLYYWLYQQFQNAQ